MTSRTDMTPDYKRSTRLAYSLFLKGGFFLTADTSIVLTHPKVHKVRPYSYLIERFGQDGMDLIESSDFGFTILQKKTGRYIVCYNEQNPYKVIRFTLAHELGHILMGHQLGEDSYEEKEANCFARNLLCPVPIADYFQLKTVKDYASFFHVSTSMASVTLRCRDSDRYYIDKDTYDLILLRTNARLRSTPEDAEIADLCGYGWAI